MFYYYFIFYDMNIKYFSIFLYIKCIYENNNNKLSCENVLIYSFLYCEMTKSQSKIVSNLNCINKQNDDSNCALSRTTYYEKEKLIHVEVYYNIFNKLTNIYNKHSEITNDVILKIIAVDDTYNNTNKYNIVDYLETSLNLGFFDVINSVPIDLTFNDVLNKNNEVTLLENILKKH